ncbi:MAG: hypothetical protein KF774_21635 [Planctomyces sp.]|nr:hypothetical protein [Planctomyces sp.]
MWHEDGTLMELQFSVATVPVVAIGWLDEHHAFRRGNVGQAVIDKLDAMYTRDVANLTRGIHGCPFCNGIDIWRPLSAGRRLLGHAELWVPDVGGDKIYAAPDLVIHYCAEHEYCPPIEFVESVMSFDLSCDWYSTQHGATS